jgi:hypothetical protein
MTPVTTICMDCAKDIILSRYINEKGISSGKCSLCQGLNTTKFIRIDDTSQIKDVFKSLIRYHYSEWDYNSHWGGNRLEFLLSRDNPIIDHTRIKLGKDDTDIEEVIFPLVEDFSWPPYADDPSTGVSLYYGYGMGGRGLFPDPIPDSRSDYLSWLESQLLNKNYFKFEDEALNKIAPYKKLISKEMPKGQIYYRARIGFEERKIKIFDDTEVHQEIYFPYVNDKIGSPPPLGASEGRLNRKGISFFYTANNIRTAIAEIRPHPSHLVSTGEFKAKEKMNIATLTNLDFYYFIFSDVLLDLYILLQSLDRKYSMPILPGEANRYLVSQFYAEIFRKLGFKGVEYRSSISSGINYCFFDVEDFEYIENSATVKRVALLNYSFVDAEYELEPEIADNIGYYP